ncbi:Hypothetical predicted protein [Mytilus galloprovincialis]|uniref:G-protein coupled receptors family 1 profile domain-containing protein n=1 Tax=Mytilus galloprovincialis TaxID=29158 RepID=A0A8B6BHS7_MYTGA|nr:Hypothetical predicted protein [Mytilus galloprovincialis]
MDSENITEGNLLMEETNSTKLLEWEISYEAQIISAVYLSTGIFIGLITNTLLILVICLSPTLRTPPNYHLKSFVICQESDYLPEPGKICMAVIICFFYVVALISTLSSYYTISKELNIIKPKTSNKILPISRAMSLSSEDTCDPQNHYQIEPNIPSQNGSLQVYTIQCADSEETVVHYQKNENMVTFEEVFALQNPILAQSMANSKRPLQATLSNASTQSRTSRIDFTDISPNADLQRFQMMKNNSALRNQTLRRDRISVRSATKNSFIMFTGYLLSSLPLIICSVPYATARSESIATRVYIFLFLKFLFYANAFVSSTWYLFFSKRVRKCLFKLLEGSFPCIFGRR